MKVIALKKLLNTIYQQQFIVTSTSSENQGIFLNNLTLKNTDIICKKRLVKPFFTNAKCLLHLKNHSILKYPLAINLNSNQHFFNKDNSIIFIKHNIMILNLSHNINIFRIQNKNIFLTTLSYSKFVCQQLFLFKNKL